MGKSPLCCNVKQLLLILRRHLRQTPLDKKWQANTLYTQRFHQCHSVYGKSLPGKVVVVVVVVVVSVFVVVIIITARFSTLNALASNGKSSLPGFLFAVRKSSIKNQDKLRILFPCEEISNDMANGN